MKEGHTPDEIALMFGYTARWMRAIVQRWNAELYDNTGKLVWRQTVFDDYPPPWMRFKRP
jgi:hypothetical protein